ncbi:MAG: preprotein translocase subunit YajC [Acetatifactor sp.]|nr:preprotein translocase subunit YajC [Acetatifactor sp.]
MAIFLTAEADMAAAGWGSIGSMIIMYGLLFLAFWFFILRPNSKEKKRMAAMLSNLELGDCVMTSSGFYGIIIDITDDTVIVEFGNNKNCRIPMDKSAIAKVEKANE